MTAGHRLGAKPAGTLAVEWRTGHAGCGAGATSRQAHRPRARRVGRQLNGSHVDRRNEDKIRYQLHPGQACWHAGQPRPACEPGRAWSQDMTAVMWQQTRKQSRKHAKAPRVPNCALCVCCALTACFPPGCKRESSRPQPLHLNCPMHNCLGAHWFPRMCLCACVRPCVRACVRVRACVCSCVCAWMAPAHTR
jgi:hypothetical protein